jgi:hypothetical protein
LGLHFVISYNKRDDRGASILSDDESRGDFYLDKPSGKANNPA